MEKDVFARQVRCSHCTAIYALELRELYQGDREKYTKLTRVVNGKEEVLPTAADLDAVEAEKAIAKATEKSSIETCPHGSANPGNCGICRGKITK